MLALVSMTLAALYFIGIATAFVADVAGQTEEAHWRWHWRVLAWPWLLMSGAWDQRRTFWRVLWK